MAQRMLYHWKHGWIREDHYATIEKAHGRDETVQRLNQRIVDAGSGNQRAADARVDQLGQLLPAELRPTPHRQFAVKDFSIAGTIPAHHTGGVVFNRLQARALVRHAADINEGPVDSVDLGEINGTRSRSQVGVGSHGAQAEAKANARAVKSLLSLPYDPLPETTVHRDGRARYTGGLVLDGPTADALIKRLDELHTGTTTAMEQNRLAGRARIPLDHAAVVQKRHERRMPDLIGAIKANGGFTYSPKGNRLLEVGKDKGFAVAVPGTEQVVGRGKNVSRADFVKGVTDVIMKHSGAINQGAVLGGWYSEDRDVYMVELTQVLPAGDRAGAIAEGAKRGQEGIFDLASGEYIPTGGTGDG